MAIFNITRTATALNTTDDLLTITAASGRPLRIMVVEIDGMGTSSAANEVLLQRSTGGTTGGGAITPQDASGGGATPAMTVVTTWSAQPSLSGSPLWRFGVNAHGGVGKFVAIPGGEIGVPAAGQVSFRSASGTSSVVLNVQVEEI
jgi:hypothetical protein